MRKRFVFDTNVLLSTIFVSGSVSQKAFYKAYFNGIILFSTEIFDEVKDVFNRPKLQKYINHEAKQEFFDVLLKKVLFIEVEKRVKICRDPKDDKFLDLAIQGQANYIITGDKDLLILNPFDNIPIIQPSTLLEIDI